MYLPPSQILAPWQFPTCSRKETTSSAKRICCVPIRVHLNSQRTFFSSFSLHSAVQAALSRRVCLHGTYICMYRGVVLCASGRSEYIGTYVCTARVSGSNVCWKPVRRTFYMALPQSLVEPASCMYVFMWVYCCPFSDDAVVCPLPITTFNLLLLLLFLLLMVLWPTVCAECFVPRHEYVCTVRSVKKELIVSD